MISKETEMVGRIVDAKLSAVSGKNKDVFASKSPEVIACEKKLDEMILAHTELKQKMILSTFRGLCQEFKDTYGTFPTRALMSYHDIYDLCRAFNAEAEAKDITRPHQYSSNSVICIDGITIKQGCDQNAGEIRFYQFE